LLDIDECADKSKFPCYGNCTNTPGSYNCTCPPGYDGDAKKENGCQDVSKDSESPDAKDSKFQAEEYALGTLQKPNNVKAINQLTKVNNKLYIVAEKELANCKLTKAVDSVFLFCSYSSI